MQDSTFCPDATWERAFELAKERINVPNLLWALVRNSWSGLISAQEFSRQMGFCGVSTTCIMRAARSCPGQEEAEIPSVESAISRLGIRNAAAITAINYACRALIESSNPGPQWRKALEELMTTIQVGYAFGSRADGIGPEGGMLVGFARSVGMMILMQQDASAYERLQTCILNYEGRDMAVAEFGCEPYQVGAAALQQLGFGPDVAIGVGIASGDLHANLCQLTPEIQAWSAAYAWVNSLQSGLPCPPTSVERNFFRGLVLTTSSPKESRALQLLYRELKALKEHRSMWTWHLPRGTYEETELYMLTLAKERGYILPLEKDAEEQTDETTPASSSRSIRFF